MNTIRTFFMTVLAAYLVNVGFYTPAMAAVSTTTYMYAIADTFVIEPGAGATSTGAGADYNYGGAGSLSVAASTASQQKGEFIALLKFDFSSLVGQEVSNISLTVNLSDGNKSAGGLFNYPGSNGSFDISWFGSDWIEGSGHPLGMSTSGITFNSLESLLIADPAELLNTEIFSRSAIGSNSYSLTITDALAEAVDAGEIITLMLSATAGSEVAFNLTGNNNAMVSVTTIPEPATLALLVAGSIILKRRL